MAGDALQGKGLWHAPQLIGTIALGPRATAHPARFNAGPVLRGLLLHELTSAGMGGAYAVLLRLPPLGRLSFITAAAYALVSWVVAQYVLIPALSKTMARQSSPVALPMAHLVFGLALGLFSLWLA